MTYILGLDFGGTKLAAGLVDPASGRVIDRTHCVTPVAGGAAASIAAMLDLATGLLEQQSTQGKAHASDSPSSMLLGTGVSFGGPVEADGRTVRLSMHVPGWEGFALADHLECALGVPAAIANDGDAAALAEYRFGAGRGVCHLLYLTVSTGIGGGVIIDGRLHRGERAWAGEAGHIVLKPDGPAARADAMAAWSRSPPGFRSRGMLARGCKACWPPIPSCPACWAHSRPTRSPPGMSPSPRAQVIRWHEKSGMRRWNGWESGSPRPPICSTPVVWCWAEG